MKTTHGMGLGLVVLLALGSGWWLGRASVPRDPSATPTAAPTPAPARQILYYRNPMGLPDTSPVPKKDSMGMDYVPVYADSAPTTPGTVVLPPEKVQKLGVRTARVTRAAVSAEVSASASVHLDETRQYAIAPRFEGWIERLHANQTGMAVRRGQTLMTLYSPALLAAQQEYRIADEAARRLQDHDPAGAAAMRQLRDATRLRLRNWQVDGAALGSRGEAARLAITAPADAVVIEKPVVEGDRFEAGQTILRLADLSSVWVIAEVPVTQAAGLRVGLSAHFQTPSLPGETRDGRVDFLPPLVDTASRSVAVRVVLPNPDGLLRPGLYGQLRIEGPGDIATVVPGAAVIDSGTRQIVLVQLAEGRFEPREVHLGRRVGDRVVVLGGLAEGETVVVSGNFLIDAESNLNAALQGMEPAAGHVHGAATAPVDSEDAAPPADASAPAAADPHAGHGGGH